MTRALTIVAWLALYVAAGFSLLVESGVLASPCPPDLARLPEHVGSFTLLDELPLAPGALGEDPPQRHTLRRIRDPHGREGQLLVAYYERAQRWSGRPHDVEKCFAALGWEERDRARLDEAHRPWSRLFARDEERIRIVHWLELPGPDEDRFAWSELARRVGSLRGFRPDVASIYFEFPADAAPDDRSMVEAVAELSEAIETLW